MSNPLLDKFDELYGKKKPEKLENKEEEHYVEPEELNELINAPSISISSSVSSDSITTGTITFDINNEFPVLSQPAILTNAIDNEIISTNNSISINSSLPSYRFPENTEMEKQFCKVMKDISDKKATVSSIDAKVDKSFTGFGGQIRYTIEVVATYP